MSTAPDTTTANPQPAGSLALPPCSAFRFECENCGHKPAPQSVIKNHGDCEKCGDTVICYTVDAAECIARMADALTEIEREASGALNNAFPDEAPDVLANVAGIARRALLPNNVLDRSHENPRQP